MKRLLLLILATTLLLSVTDARAQRGPRTDWNTKGPWANTRQDATRESRTPFKIFDNVYYVGLQTVCAYLVTTNAGLVLIDTTWEETADAVLNNIRTLGFKPSDIKYIFVTHSHTDHLGGAAKIKQVSGARVAMSAEDWAVKNRPAIETDLVLKDGETIKVGDASFKFYVTPGHTPGATSIEYQVRDGGKTYRALSPGGLGMQFGPAETPVFLKSIERLKQLGPWDAMISNHPWLMPVTLDEIQKGLAARRGGPNPAVLGPQKINAWFDQVIAVTKQKLAAGE
jgi:metallo-beta-lactamase class B